MTEKDLEIQKLRRELERVKRKPVTNYERIKAMSLEEIAEFINRLSRCNSSWCVNCPLDEAINCEISGILDWLESEVKHD